MPFNPDLDRQKEIAQRELEWRRCKEDFAYWVNTYGRMWAKAGGEPIPFLLWDFQVDAAGKMQWEKKLIFLKARQLGLSWLASAYSLWKCMTVPNFHAYYVSIGLKEVQEQMERIRFIFYGLPEWMQLKAQLGGADCKDNDSLIEFPNGSALHATAGGKSAGHGISPGLIICDEWSRVEDAVRKWRAIKPSAGVDTQIFLISTSDGFGNHFADMWFEASAGTNGFIPVFYSWKEHPGYTEEYIEGQKRDFAGDIRGFKEAFPEAPEDAFLSASRSIFDAELIRAEKERIREENITFVTGYVQNEDGERSFVPQDGGYLMVYKPPSVAHEYVVGADIAEGLIGGDFSVFVVLDKTDNEVVAVFRGKIPTESYAEPLEQVSRCYNEAYLAVEANTASELILSDLKTTYPYLYLRPQRNNIADMPTLVPGFLTTATSKPRVITQLRREFSDMDDPLKVNFDIILDEMAFYEQDDKLRLRAATGHHDDCVMALAIAVEAKNTFPYREYNTIYSKHSRPSDWRGL